MKSRLRHWASNRRFRYRTGRGSGEEPGASRRMAGWLVGRLVICLCAVVVSLSFVSRSEGAYPGANGMIAYSSKLFERWVVDYTINPDGTGGAMLLDGAANRVS